MATITLRSGRTIGDFEVPYFVAEMNTSHFGDMGVARTMIERAKAAGCDCVKFQSWTEESLYSRTYYRENRIARRMVQKFSLGEPQLRELSEYCAELKIDFASTPYAEREVDFLVERCQVPFLKVASMELNNHPYLDYMGRTGVPMVLSTGMGTMDEIAAAVRVVEKTGNANLAILHCVSVYPVEPQCVRLQNIAGLRAVFHQHPIGYSDHTLGADIPAAAVALGACLLEKHFTLDRSRIGMDNQMAMEADELSAMIRTCRNVHAALGGTERVLNPEEQGQRMKMRRSLVTSRAVRAGQVLEATDIAAKRPGTGIPPAQLSSVLGRRLRVDLEEDEILRMDHLEAG